MPSCYVNPLDSNDLGHHHKSGVLLLISNLISTFNTQSTKTVTDAKHDAAQKAVIATVCLDSKTKNKELVSKINALHGVVGVSTPFGHFAR
jgi:hypothetical protein